MRAWSGRQECENDGGEVSDDTGRAAHNRLYINTLGVFRVAKTTTLILAKCLIFSYLLVTLH